MRGSGFYLADLNKQVIVFIAYLRGYGHEFIRHTEVADLAFPCACLRIEQTIAACPFLNRGSIADRLYGNDKTS